MRGEKRKETPTLVSLTGNAGDKPPGGTMPARAGLGAVRGADGAIASTSTLPSAPAEAADVPQTLSEI